MQQMAVVMTSTIQASMHLSQHMFKPRKTEPTTAFTLLPAAGSMPQATTAYTSHHQVRVNSQVNCQKPGQNRPRRRHQLTSSTRMSAPSLSKSNCASTTRCKPPPPPGPPKSESQNRIKQQPKWSNFQPASGWRKQQRQQPDCLPIQLPGCQPAQHIWAATTVSVHGLQQPLCANL